MSALLEFRNLTKKYGAKLAVDRINLTIEGGHIIGLLGPNGSGKTTLIKMINGLLTPTSGSLSMHGQPIGIYSKKHISYLPDHTYLNMNQRVSDVITYFADFYEDFDQARAYDMLAKLSINPKDRLKAMSKGTKEKVQLILVMSRRADFYEDFDQARAYDMLAKLSINPKDRLKAMSKGTKEKVQLILVMSRRADLYILDEPIAGVDPAARDYILNVILSNYDPKASIMISTHLIADIENILDEVIFIQNGQLRLTSSVDDIRQRQGKSIDALFREVFRC